jgi:CRP/FNR family transcriptional regulator, cyclic AMP receptor protein
MASPSMKERVESLRSVPLFSLIGEKQLRAIAKECKTRKVVEGDRLTEEGEFGREFSMVVSGSARCLVDGREIRKFGPGSFFGELALLAGGRRSATIIAETPMELLQLDRGDFTILVRTTPYVAIKIMESLASRLQEADRQVTD